MIFLIIHDIKPRNRPYKISVKFYSKLKFANKSSENGHVTFLISQFQNRGKLYFENFYVIKSRACQFWAKPDNNLATTNLATFR